MISIHEAAKIAYSATTNPALWQSIVINKRKPYTHRTFINHEDSRICLHRFEACEPKDSFAHPHPWPSAMLILSGEYEMAVSHTPDLESNQPSPVIDLKLSAGSIYQMNERQAWHRVIPRTECYSLMVNGPRWEKAHRLAPSTVGKGLLAMDEDMLVVHLSRSRELLGAFLNQNQR